MLETGLMSELLSTEWGCRSRKERCGPEYMNYGMIEWMNGEAAGEIGLEVGHHRAFNI